MFSHKKVILFDMDGTLIDSIGIWNEVDRLLLDRISTIPVKEDLQSQRDSLLREFKEAKNPYHEYCRVLKEKYLAKESVEDIVQLRYEIASYYLENEIDYKQNADLLIKTLKEKDYRLGITTTTKASNMDVYRLKNKNIITKANLNDYFDFIYTREDVHKIKPDPEIYQLVMEKHGYQKEECLIIEDSLVGIEAALNAGIDVIAIYDTYSQKDLDAIKSKVKAYYNTFDEIIKEA